MILPERLKPGDTVGIIAPAGNVDEVKLSEGLKVFQQLGLEVKLGNYLFRERGYLAGEEEERVQDIHDMFQDDEVKAIFCARGGYGSGGLVDAIDFELIKHHPKIFWGYSDITYLHIAIRQQAGLVTFHGPMVASDMAKPEFESQAESIVTSLFTPVKREYTESISPLQVIRPGHATGELVGGNLSLIVSTLGTPYEIDTRGKLLLIEDVDEAPYRVDSMLNQLRLSNKITEAAGIVIGDFKQPELPKKPSLSLGEVFHDYFANHSGPVMSGFLIGHCFPHFPVPLGVEATLDTDQLRFMIQPGIT